MVSRARGRAELGRFLRSRRDAARPEGDDGSTERRVPGLRRGEVAAAAGVSPGYYARLEQGRAGEVSEQVLTALGRVLRLDDAESAHLLALARPAARTPAESSPESPPEHVEGVVAALDHLPALVLGRTTDVLCWNPRGHALLAGHLPFGAPTEPRSRPNWSRLLFLDPLVRARFVDWPAKAHDTVADLRVLLGRRPDDRRLTDLVAGLRGASPDFAALWAGRRVVDCHRHVRDYVHPLVGPLRLTDALFDVPGAAAQRLVVFTAEPGSDSAAALDRLVPPRLSSR